MIAHGIVPDDFGLGIIIPLVKDKSGDFNSITLTPIISMLLESVLLTWCEDQLVVDDLQFGFRKHIGCADAIFTLMVYYVVDHLKSRGSTVYAAALDISKAFDTVNHSQLMLKLAQVCIPNWVTNLISNWYTKLHVAVRWNGFMSVYFKVNNGVRQGSILSPGLLTVGCVEVVSSHQLCLICTLIG